AELLKSFLVETTMTPLVQRATDESNLDAGLSLSRPTVIARRAPFKPSMEPESFGEPSSDVTVLWDNEMLYLRFDMKEPRMQSMRANEHDHDGRIWLDDSLEFFLCPQRVCHCYRQLIVNSAGGWYDGVGSMNNTASTGWDVKPRIDLVKHDTMWRLYLTLSWKD